MPWCPRCGTGISEHEIVTEGYQERTHLSRLRRVPAARRARTPALLVWTTTPWTLAANVAAAVHPELTYVQVEQDGKRVLRRQGRRADRAPRRVRRSSREVKGAELVGRPYHGPFDELPARSRASSTASSPGTRSTPPKAPASSTSRPAAARRTSRSPRSTTCRHRADRRVRRLRRRLRLADRAVRPRGRRRRSCREPRAEGAALPRRAVHAPLPALLALQHRAGLPAGRRVVHRHGRAAPADDGRHPPDQLDPRVRPGPRARLAAHMDDWMISKKRYWGLALPIYECAACGNVRGHRQRDRAAGARGRGLGRVRGHTPHRPWIDAVKIACAQLRRDGLAHQGRRQPLARRRHRAVLDAATTGTTASTGRSGSRPT